MIVKLHAKWLLMLRCDMRMGKLKNRKHTSLKIIAVLLINNHFRLIKKADQCNTQYEAFKAQIGSNLRVYTVFQIM